VEVRSIVLTIIISTVRSKSNRPGCLHTRPTIRFIRYAQFIGEPVLYSCISALGSHNLSGRWGLSGDSAHFCLSCNALYSLSFYKGATPQLVCGKELRFIQHVTEGTSERDYSIWQAYLFWAQWIWSRRINIIRCTQGKSSLYKNYRRNSTPGH
jgi:hypothetical protein